MDSGDFKTYKGGVFERLIYDFQPMMRLPKYGSLELYEEDKWIPATESKNDIRKELGFDVYEIWERWIIELGYEDRILGFVVMRKWARWASKSRFTLIGMVLSISSIMLNIPLGLMVGLPLSLISLYLGYVEVTKPMFPPYDDIENSK